MGIVLSATMGSAVLAASHNGDTLQETKDNTAAAV